MAFEDRTCWVVQGGPRGRYVEDFTDKGIASTAWELDALGDLRATSDADVFLLLEAQDRRKPADDLRDLRIFTDRIADGDVLVVPDTPARDLLFGEVSGPYAYDAAGGPHRHQRPVRWFGRLATDQVDGLLLGTATVRQPVRRLAEQLHWQRLAGEVDDLLGRPAGDRPVKRPVARTASASSSGPRSGGSARRAATPKPALVPDRLCPSCGLLRAPTLFPDGEDVCRDCA